MTNQHESRSALPLAGVKVIEFCQVLAGPSRDAVAILTADLDLDQITRGRFDLDVVGSLKVKELYCDRAITIFILPPSSAELERRLTDRNTDSREVRRIRLTNAMTELTFQDRFDHRVINDDLDRAMAEVQQIVKSYLTT